jgi:hypothetical protein
VVSFSDGLDDFSLRFRVEAAPNAPKEPIAKSPAVEEGSGITFRLLIVTHGVKHPI